MNFELLIPISVAFILLAMVSYSIFQHIESSAKQEKAFMICNDFCQCNKEQTNLTIHTYFSEVKRQGFVECQCLVSEFNNATVWYQPRTFVISENWRCD